MAGDGRFTRWWRGGRNFVASQLGRFASFTSFTTFATFGITAEPARQGDASVIRFGPTLKIVGVDPERGFAGGETQVLGLSLALIRAGHQADLICDPDGVLWQRATAAGITCFPLRIRNSIDAAAGLRLRSLLVGKGYDVVHFHTARAHALAPFARGQTAVAVVTRRMDYAPNRVFGPLLFNRAVDGVAAISRAVADTLVQAGVRKDRVAIIPSGVDCDRFRPPAAAARERARIALGLTARDIAVGTVGMLEPRKGHRHLLEAMELLRDSGAAGAADAVGPRVRCFIAGAGSLSASLADEIRAQRMDESVSLMGLIGDSRNLLWALDIFAMPSLQEGLGVAALEAMACGLPVIASSSGGLVDSVKDGVTGMHVPPGDARALADAIARMAANAQLRSTMGAAGRERAVLNFAMESMARGTLALYRACLQDRARSRRG